MITEKIAEKFQRGKILLLCGALLGVGWLANSLHTKMHQQFTGADNLAIAGREIADRLSVELKNYSIDSNAASPLPLLPPTVRDFRLTPLSAAKPTAWTFSFYITDAPVAMKSPREISELSATAEEKRELIAQNQKYRWEYLYRVITAR